MDISVKKYPAVWYRGRQRQYDSRERTRIDTIDAIKKALNQLQERYTWDDAYIFGSVSSAGRYGAGSDIDIALSGLDKLAYFAFIGDISEIN